MGNNVVRAARTALAVGAIVGVATLGGLLPAAAITTNAATTLPAVEAENRAGGAAMLGGWVGGGILLLGTGVLVASISVRRTGAESADQPVVVDHASALVDA